MPIKIESDGYPSDDFLVRDITEPETPYACLWNAMGHLAVILHSDPNNAPAAAAVWEIQESIVKINAGEAFIDPANRQKMEQRMEELRQLARPPAP